LAASRKFWGCLENVGGVHFESRLRRIAGRCRASMCPGCGLFILHKVVKTPAHNKGKGAGRQTHAQQVSSE
ncbi:MAG: hypothetical protein OEY60_17270, partial [Nitrospira sp.]|nr:hypothetical protein [Nitrospira sp.]